MKRHSCVKRKYAITTLTYSCSFDILNTAIVRIQAKQSKANVALSLLNTSPSSENSNYILMSYISFHRQVPQVLYVFLLVRVLHFSVNRFSGFWVNKKKCVSRTYCPKDSKCKCQSITRISS